MPYTYRWIKPDGVGDRAPGSIEVIEDHPANTWLRRGWIERVTPDKADDEAPKQDDTRTHPKDAEAPKQKVIRVPGKKK